MGIVTLPVVAKRKKQNLKDLNIDDNGDIMLDDDEDDEDVEEEDITFTRSSRRNHPNSRKRKAVTQVKEKKRQKVQTSYIPLQCLHCNLSLTRNYSPLRPYRLDSRFLFFTVLKVERIKW